MKQKNLYFYTNLLAWGLVFFLVGNYVFGWTTPSATPPSSNLPAPINVSSTAQSKVGYLAIATSTAPTIPLQVIGNGYFSGSVGIGTTEPRLPLSVYGIRSDPPTTGTTAVGNVELKSSAGWAMDIGGMTTSPYSWWFQTVDPNDQSQHVPIVLNPSGGNVGIGTTTPATKLQISGGDVLVDNTQWYRGLNSAGTQQPLIRSRGMGYNPVGYTGIQVGQTGDEVALFIDPGTIAGGSFNGSNNELLFPNAVNFLQGNSGSTDWITTMALNNGNVGIGTTGPDKLLHVQAADGVTGVIEVEGGKSTVTAVGEVNSKLDFGSRDTSATGGIGGSIQSITEYDNGAYVGMGFFTARQGRDPVLKEAMRIDNSGNVGIGTTDPGTAKLKISGGVLDMSTQKITNLATPTADTDAATKGYVDAAGATCAKVLTIDAGSAYCGYSAHEYCQAKGYQHALPNAQNANGAGCSYYTKNGECGQTTTYNPAPYECAYEQDMLRPHGSVNRPLWCCK